MKTFLESTNVRWWSFTALALMVCASAMAQVLLREDFQSYPLHTWPAPGWGGFGGNEGSDPANNRVELDPQDASKQVLKLYGITEGMFAAAANHEMVFPSQFSIHCRIYNGAEIPHGGHAVRGIIAVRQGTHWSSPAGFYPLTFSSSSQVIWAVDGSVLQNYECLRWYDVQIDYSRNGDLISLHYWIDGADRGAVTMVYPPLLDHFEFQVGTGTAYFDDLLVLGSGLRITTEPTPLTENSGLASIRVERLRDVDQPTTIRYGVTGGTATPGVDFFLTNGVLEFAAGITNLTIPLTIIDDALVEGPETILLSLTNSATGWTNQVSLTLLDDDTGIELESATYTVSEGAGQVVLGVRRQDDSPDLATVQFTTVDGSAAGAQDYVATTGTLTFASGETNKQIIVPIVDDAIREPAEIFSVRLTNATGGSSMGILIQAIVTIEKSDLATLHVWQGSPNPTPPYLSWATAATNIQDAVDAALSGETVVVTNGLYSAGGRTVGTNLLSNRVVITNAVRLESVNGPAVTIIEGARAPVGDANGNGDGAVRCVYLGLTNAVVSGFTLTNGHTRTAGDWEREQIGGGVWGETYWEAGGVLTNCVITGNSAGSAGGGACYCTLYNCTLAANSAVYDGQWWHGGTGGGAFRATLYNCTLRGNSAGELGGGAYSGTLYNCTFTGNSASWGGGACESKLYNCTLTGNSAAEGGGVDRCNLFNSIAYFNRAPIGANYFNDESNPSQIEYSCTTPLPPGLGNIDAAPQFLTTTHLVASSPCRGAGNAAYASGLDIDGEPWANPPSMGADELVPGNATGPLSMSIVASYTNCAVGYIAQFTAHNTGSIVQSVWDFGDGTRLTNQPFANHAWTAPGTYTVTLTGFNDSHPEGVTANIRMEIVSAIHCVNLVNATPVAPYSSWATAATNIQDAIDAGTTIGRLVLVTNGVYEAGARELNGELNRVVITNPITLRSVNGPLVTTIAGGQIANEVGEVTNSLRCVFLGNDAVLSGFTLTNGGATSGGGVFGESSGAVVSNCVLTGNSSFGNAGGGGAYGVTLNRCTLTGNTANGFRAWLGGYAGLGGGAAECTLTNCTVNGNVATDGWRGGLMPQGYPGSGGGAYSSTLYNCTLHSNSAGDGGGAYGSTLYNCVLTGNSAGMHGGGAYGEDWAPCVLINCTLSSNSAWFGGGGAAGATLNNCTLTRNFIIEPDYGGGGVVGGTLNNCILYFNIATNGANYLDSTLNYCCTTPMPTNGVSNIAVDPQLASVTHLSSTSPCIGAGSSTYATGADIDGEPWANPPCIGVDQLTPGSATGGITVRIRADYASVTVGFVVSLVAEVEGRLLSSVWDFGDGTSRTNQPYVSHAWLLPGTYPVRLTACNDSHPEGVSTTLTIYVWAQDATVVYYVNQANPTPVTPYTSWASAANTIQDAIDAVGPGSQRNVVLVANGVYATGTQAGNRVAASKPLLLQSVNGPQFTVIDGGATIRCIYLTNGAGLAGFTLRNGFAESGGGVYCESASSVVSKCVITGNSASWGGGGVCGGTLYNCTVTGNSAWSYGGGAYGATLNNCTLIGNSGSEGGGVSWSSLYNCIVYYNTAVNGSNSLESTFNYCCTTPLLISGVGNISNAPLFVNPAAGDFSLQGTSPCIDAGTNLSSIITTDILGLPRPMDGNNDGVARFDIGAYESNPYRFDPVMQMGIDGFRFTVRGEPGRSVRIDRSRDLLHWEPAGWVPIPASGQTLIDPAATSEPKLFYRMMREP